LTQREAEKLRYLVQGGQTCASLGWRLCCWLARNMTDLLALHFSYNKRLPDIINRHEFKILSLLIRIAIYAHFLSCGNQKGYESHGVVIRIKSTNPCTMLGT
jgi:hypothetical protein